MRVIDEKITHFLTTLNLGLEWVADAGKELVAMLDTNPSAFMDILDTKPPAWVTVEVLRTLEAIGRGQISPELLIVPLHVFSRLSVLPPDEQMAAVTKGVEVVSRVSNGGYHKTSKPACRLTRQEASRAIGPNGFRTPAEQRKMLKPPKSLGWFQVSLLDDVEDADCYILTKMDAAPKTGESHRLRVKTMEFAIELLVDE